MDKNARNKHEAFDDLVNEKLGFHVYALFNPETKLPFYVGKGGGSFAEGNQRVLDHFAEARKAIGEPDCSEKVKAIHAIWERGSDVEWRILRNGLPQLETAFEVEAAVIDTLTASGIKLTNVQGGHHSSASGLLTEDELYIWAARPIKPAECPSSLRNRLIFVFNIANAVKDGRSHKEALRYSWHVAEKWRENTHCVAVGLIKGVSHAAFGIASWETLDNTTKVAINFSDLSKAEESYLLHKQYAEIITSCGGYWGRGNYLVIDIPDSGNAHRILRGKKRD